jgi:hypothetical protein
MKPRTIVTLTALSALACNARASRPPAEEPASRAERLTAAPALLDLRASASEVGLPREGDVASVELAFHFARAASPIRELALVVTAPDGADESLTLDGVERYGVIGADGEGRYRVTVNRATATGHYKYALTLRDADGAESETLTATLTVRDDLAAPLAVVAVSPAAARPGEVFTLTGEGFGGRPDVNVVTVGGARARVLDGSATTLRCEVPANAVTGAPVVQSPLGRSTAPSTLTVTPAVTLRAAPATVAAGAKVRFTADVAGAARGDVTWRVNGVPGGRADLGFIDASGTYTAPAVPPAEGAVEVRAVSAAAPTVYAATRITLTAPLPQVVAGALAGAAGGTFSDRAGLAAVTFAPGAVDRDVTLARVEAGLLDPARALAGVADGVPLARVRVEPRDAAARVTGAVTARVLLPRRLSADTVLQVHREGSTATLIGTASPDAGGVSVTLRLSGWGSYVVSARVPAAQYDFAPIGMPAAPVTVTAVSTPAEGPEEGATFPVLVEGANFWPGFTRVTIARIQRVRNGGAPVDLAPQARADLDGVVQDKNPVVGPVLVDATRTRLGFTLRVPDLTELARGDQLLLGLRIERLSLGGRPAFGAVTTDPSRLQVRGLPELIVRTAGSNLYAVDGTRIDATVSSSERYSTVEVAAGLTLGVGSAVTTAAVGATPALSAVDLSSLGRFEAVFGPVPEIPASVSRTAARVFQPARAPVSIEATGPVDLRGNVYLAGMRGGENPNLAQAAGAGRPGGLVGGFRSGGNGGNGGVTTAGGAPQDGSLPGHGIQADGVGTSLASGPLNVAPAPFGSRFDAVTRAASDLELVANVGVAVVSSVVSPGNALQYLGGAAVDLIGAAVASPGCVDCRVGGRVNGGSGGHGGRRASGQSAALVDDAALHAGTGGGGGGGGGSSAFTETLFGFTLGTDHRRGGAGAGGGGAAASLRITGADVVDLRGGLLGAGGRGGHGELHHWLASPGGGGGGGAGAVLKVQGVRAVRRGAVDISGGLRGTALQLTSRGAGQAPYVRARVQAIDTVQGRGAFAFYRPEGSRGRDELTLSYSTGRVRSVQVAFPTLAASLREVRALGNAFLPFGARAVLAVDGASHLHVLGLPDLDTGLASALDFDFGSLAAAIPGLRVTDVAQSPAAPHNIYVAGVRGAASSEIHELDASGRYLRCVLQQETVDHIRDLEVLSDGQRIAALMTTVTRAGGRSVLEAGLHLVNVATGARSFAFYRGDETNGMTVMRGAARDEVVFSCSEKTVDCDGGCNHVPWVERLTLAGVASTHRAFHVESTGQPGDPGLLRVDGELPGAAALTARFDGDDLRQHRYGGAPVAYAAPVIGSFSGPATSASAMESLVFLAPDVTAYAQGADPRDALALPLTVYRASAAGTVATPVPSVDPQGRAQAVVRLSPGFNAVWIQSSTGGRPSALLRRNVLAL